MGQIEKRQQVYLSEKEGEANSANKVVLFTMLETLDSILYETKYSPSCKNPKTFAKILEQEHFESCMELEKTNPNIELVEPFLENLNRKPVALTKTIFTR